MGCVPPKLRPLPQKNPLLDELFNLVAKGATCAYCAAQNCGCGGGKRVFIVGKKRWSQIVKLRDYANRYIVSFESSGPFLLGYPVELWDGDIVEFMGHTL